MIRLDILSCRVFAADLFGIAGLLALNIAGPLLTDARTVARVVGPRRVL